MAKKITDDGEVLDDVTHEVVAMAPPFFKTPFNHDRDLESLSTGLTCKDASKTQQQFAKDSDINEILRKFAITGQLPQTGTPEFGEPDERDLMDRMVTSWDVEQAWLKLPVEARAILQTPQKFVEWYDQCLETGNIEGLRQIGLLPPEKAQDPPTKPPTPAVPPVTAPAVTEALPPK